MNELFIEFFSEEIPSAMQKEGANKLSDYITKKLTGKQKQEYPPYATMSRGKRDNNQGGLGYRWLKQYHKDVYNNDYVVMRGGFKSKPPRYYDKIC